MPELYINILSCVYLFADIGNNAATHTGVIRMEMYKASYIDIPILEEIEVIRFTTTNVWVATEAVSDGRIRSGGIMKPGVKQLRRFSKDHSFFEERDDAIEHLAGMVNEALVTINREKAKAEQAYSLVNNMRGAA